MTIGLTHVLVLSCVLAVGGILTILLKRNAIGILVGVELILNAAALNFVAAGRFPPAGRPPVLDGDVAAMFLIFIAAAEAAVALAVFLSFYNNHSSVDVESGSLLKESKANATD